MVYAYLVKIQYRIPIILGLTLIQNIFIFQINDLKFYVSFSTNFFAENQLILFGMEVEV